MTHEFRAKPSAEFRLLITESRIRTPFRPVRRSWSPQSRARVPSGAGSVGELGEQGPEARIVAQVLEVRIVRDPFAISEAVAEVLGEDAQRILRAPEDGIGAGDVVPDRWIVRGGGGREIGFFGETDVQICWPDPCKTRGRPEEGLIRLALASALPSASASARWPSFAPSPPGPAPSSVRSSAGTMAQRHRRPTTTT
jgi:hypothetical protein